MSTTIAGGTVLDQILDEVPGLGWKYTGTATSGGAVVTTTDAEINKLGSGNVDSTRFLTGFNFIPTGTATTDDIHSISTIAISGATTTITTLGNYGATYTAVSMYILAIHPRILINLMNDALEWERVDYTAPLCHFQFTDHDMAASTSGSYTDSASAVSSKVTTSANNYEGPRAMRVLNSATNQYTESASLQVTTNSPCLVWGIGRAQVGTAQLILRGTTTATALQTITTSESRFQYMWARGSVGSNKAVTVRPGGVGATDDTTWAALCFLETADTFLPLPSHADQRDRIRVV